MPSVCIVSGQIQNEAGVFVLCVLCRYQELRVRSTALLKPEYSESFRCIGPACEDSCCEEWTIHVDQSTFEKYKALPAGPLRTIVDENIQRISEETSAKGGSAVSAFAQIRMNADRNCPLLSADGLCRMQSEHGEAFLSHMCATYPRIVSSIGGLTEKALSLSCPEAARLVLLRPQLAMSFVEIDESPTREETASGDDTWLPHFWTIRDFALALVRNRVYPLWQRLFLVGLFSSRFDAIAPGDLGKSVPQLLDDFAAAVASRNLQASMETLPVDHAQQLDVVLRLAGMLLHRSNLRPRFLECIQAFTQGIGNGPTATLESLTACYAEAHDYHFAPFFERHPYILENYLINTIFRCRFPFGRDWARNGSAPSMSREFALLTAQFALIKGLLIGVAGFHRDGLSTDHVVHTFQAASKHFEHHTEFLTQAHALLVESRMDGALGMAILLRNAESNAPRPALPAIHPPIQPPVPTGGTVVFPVPRRPANGPHLPGPAMRRLAHDVQPKWASRGARFKDDPDAKRMPQSALHSERNSRRRALQAHRELAQGPRASRQTSAAGISASSDTTGCPRVPSASASRARKEAAPTPVSPVHRRDVPLRCPP
jgi:lysine-N-methylase